MMKYKLLNLKAQISIEFIIYLLLLLIIIFTIVNINDYLITKVNNNDFKENYKITIESLVNTNLEYKSIKLLENNNNNNLNNKD